MKIRNFPVFTVLLLITVAASAEVYRWVDSEGKVHYSDKNPSKKNAQDVTAKVSKSNIDESAVEARKLEKIFAEETLAEKQMQQLRQNKQRAEQEQLRHKCDKARHNLKKLKGRVVFVDKSGKAYDVSEKVRQQEVEKLQHKINQHCS